MSGTGVIGLVVHSGGPTPVINASLVGVIEEARKQPGITGLYGAAFGLDGVLREHFIDLFAQSRDRLEAIASTPSSALGTSRLEVGDAEIERTLQMLRARNVRYFFYTGGNGSMGTASRIARLARDSGYPLQVIGIPKTIDNDLMMTDHTPGYPSTARFFACAARDIGADNRALPGQVVFLEVLGRNAGWLVAATSLARKDPDDAPHLIYFPEVRLPSEQLLDDVDRVFARLGRCVVAVCEGQLDENGEPFGADVRKSSRGSLAMNVAHRLAMLTAERLNLRTRSEKPGLLGRSHWDVEPRLDRAEARMCGHAAVLAACEGHSGVMVTLVRKKPLRYLLTPQGADYQVSTGLTALEPVAFVERLFPAEWRNEAANDVLPAFQEYARPLVGPVPAYEQLD